MSEPIRVLIVEDSEADAELLLLELQDGGYDPEHEVVETPEAMAVALNEQHWDVIIADYVMPHFSGLDALRIIQEKRLDIPFIMVSGKIGEDVAIETMLAGAKDYVLKSNLARLVPATKREIQDTRRRKRANEARKQAEEALQRAYDEQEQRIAERTAELLTANWMLSREIEERKLAEEALRDIEERFKSFMDNSPAVAWAKDEQGRHVYLNKSFERSFGVRLEDWYGKTDFELWPQAIAQTFRHNDLAVLTSGQAQEVTEETIDSDGKRRYWWNFKFPFQDASGNKYVGGVGVDITERKQAEQEIQNLNIELEQRVADRTAKLEDINKELEAFSYSVSHDLRAPLRSIAGFSKELLDSYSESLDETGKDYLHQVRVAAQKMAQLIDALLRLSRVGRAEMHHQQVDLSAVAREILDDLKTAEPDRIVEVDIAPNVVATGDPDLLRIVMDNLLRNAWKFTSKKEEVRIEFGVTQQDSERVFFIRDNGAGFNMARADKLFVPFQRLHSETRFPGTGIGLALVQRIIRRHEGRIWAEGAVEQGATFYFTLGEQAND